MEFNYSTLYDLASRPNFDHIIIEWFNSGFLAKVLPEINVLNQYIHNPKYHPEGNPFQHTVEALKIAESIELSAIEKLAVLFHDVGKGATADNYDADTHPYHNFYNHEHVGLKVFDNISARLNIPYSDAETIKYCIEYHMKVHKFKEIKKMNKIKNIVLHKDWPILKNVVYCDCASQKDKFNSENYWDCIKIGDNTVFDL